VNDATPSAASREATERSFGRLDAALIAAVLVADYTFKRFVSRASAEDLDFLLAPTAALVRCLTGHAFVSESGAGYFSRDLMLIIAPACSGANFAIVLFTALAAGYVGRLRTAHRKLAWMLAALVLAYVTTVLTNTVRITLAATLRAHPFFDAGVSHAAAHRALGVAVYLTALIALDGAAGGLLGAPRKRAGFALACYLGVTLVTPLLGGASATGPFLMHAALVLGATTFVAAVLWLSGAHALASRRAQGVASDTRVHRRVLRARRDGERPLSGQGGSPLVPLAVD